MTLNAERLNTFLGKAVGDLGAAFSAVLVVLGDELGLYKALAREAHTPAALAARTGTSERYVREWLGNQAAGGYVDFDAASGTYRLNDEQAACLADPAGPVDLAGAYEIALALFHTYPRVRDNFRSGEGMEWGDHHPCLFHGVERFFRGGYHMHLLGEWLPALDGVVEKLSRGGKVADIGCGHGASTVLMAKAYPASHFIGYDYHGPSIDVARERAAAAGVTNASFEQADASGYTGRDFDLIAFFDCLHDMGDPTGAARHARGALKDDGTCMIVEPFAGNTTADNLNPVGRVYYAASSMICVPVSLARQGPALGAQAGEARLREVVVDAAGFRSLRRAAESPFNIVLEARP